MRVTAVCNDTVAMISWDPGEAKIENCLGYAITRIDDTAHTAELLESYALFKGETSTAWIAKKQSESPVQKMTWMDFVAAQGHTIRYKVVAMIGTPGNLKASKEIVGTSNPVTLTTIIDETFEAGFTAGILSTQALAHQLGTNAKGNPDFDKLITAIHTPGDPIRESLMRNVMKLDKKPIELAKQIAGHVLQKLYELSDPEFEQWLIDNPDAWSLILGNTGKSASGVEDETNAPFRAKAHAAGWDIHDRMLGSSSIAHDKFQVTVDKRRRGVMANTGSTNKTPTGYCCQSNNVCNIHSAEVADLFVEQFDLILADDSSQGKALRAANATRKKDVVLKDGTKITVWFSPNTSLRMKPKANAPTPPDMQEIFDCLDQARQVFFLAFFPGAPSIITYLADIINTKPGVLVRGAVSSPGALPRTKLFHRPGELPAMVAASGIELDFANYMKEIVKLPSSHAVIHDKVIVINPFSDDCIVIFGSHNLGFKASYQNDENLIIVRGHKKLAQAYMVHCLDVYNHYRFRSAVNAGKSKFDGFLDTTDGWQTKYLSGEPRKEVQLFAGTITE